MGWSWVVLATNGNKPPGANPALAAEVELDDIPELLGEIERLRSILGAAKSTGGLGGGFTNGG